MIFVVSGRRNMNELRLILEVAKRAIEKQIEANPKAGVKFDAPNKMRYKDALVGIADIINLYRLHGSFNIGICKECCSFNLSGCQSIRDCFGRCDKAGGKTVHKYETCDRFNK